MKINNRPMNIIYEESKGGTLWLGSLEAASDLSLLDEMGINTVITVAVGLKISYPDKITHITYEIADDIVFPIIDIFSDAAETIFEQLQHGSVLVHCMTGISRGPTIVIAYLMKRMKWNFDRTYSYVLDRRMVDPNSSFKRQLAMYEDELKRTRFSQCSSVGNLFEKRKPLIVLDQKTKGKKLNLNFKSQIQSSTSTNIGRPTSHRAMYQEIDKNFDPFLNFISPESRVGHQFFGTNSNNEPTSQTSIIYSQKQTKIIIPPKSKLPLSLLLKKHQSLIKEEDTPTLFDTPKNFRSPKY